MCRTQNTFPDRGRLPGLTSRRLSTQNPCAGARFFDVSGSSESACQLPCQQIMPHLPAGSVRPCPRKLSWRATDATFPTGRHHADSTAKPCQTSYLCAPPSQSLTPGASRPDAAGTQRTPVANGNEARVDTKPCRSPAVPPDFRSGVGRRRRTSAIGPLSPGKLLRPQRTGHLCAAQLALEETSATAEDNAGTRPRQIRGYRRRLPLEKRAATPNRGRTQEPALTAAETGFDGTAETGTVLEIRCCDPLSSLVL